MKENPYYPIVECSTDIPADELNSYTHALSLDPVGQTRRIVGVCRASGSRRKDLKSAIEEGNKLKTWGEIIRVVQLLRDCETRWSSTYNMIDRMMELYPVKPSFLYNASYDDLPVTTHSLSKIFFSGLPWPTTLTTSSQASNTKS
jgi:hypothetical protein